MTMGNGLFAQQLPLYNQYRDFGFIINPAMSGAMEQEAAGLFFRYQWTRMPDSPMTAFATFDTYRLMEDYNMGLSGYLMHDQTGPIMSNGLGLNYAYNLTLESYSGDEHHIAMGFQAGLFQHRLDADKLITLDENDPLVVGDDATAFLPEIGVGLFYRYESYLGVGFAVPQILGLTANFKGAGGEISPINKERHYYGMVHGKIPIDYDETTFFMPSIWTKYVAHSPFHVDINLKLIISNRFLVGLGYSTSNMLSGEVGALISERYKIAYNYSTQFSANNTYLGDSHEIKFIFIIDSEDFGYYY